MLKGICDTLLRLVGRDKGALSRRERTRREDFLKALYHYGLVCSSDELVETIRKQARLSEEDLPRVVGELALEGWIELNPLRLTVQGRERALRLVRAHRIYEKYLAEHSGYSPEEWHARAEEMEHKLNGEEQERIMRLLHNPLWDPHGDPIPTEGNVVLYPQATTSEAIAGEWYQVQHVEDDDAELFRAINKLGLTQGCILKLIGHRDNEIDLWFEGERGRLPLEALKSLSLRRLDAQSTEVETARHLRRLSRLMPGETAMIQALSPACVGAMRRRLMDLGFVRGSEVSIDMRSPLGNPTAYVVRQTAIALREDQARHILISG